MPGNPRRNRRSRRVPSGSPEELARGAGPVAKRRPVSVDAACLSRHPPSSWPDPREAPISTSAPACKLHHRGRQVSLYRRGPAGAPVTTSSALVHTPAGLVHGFPRLFNMPPNILGYPECTPTTSCGQEASGPGSGNAPDHRSRGRSDDRIGPRRAPMRAAPAPRRGPGPGGAERSRGRPAPGGPRVSAGRSGGCGTGMGDTRRTGGRRNRARRRALLPTRAPAAPPGNRARTGWPRRRPPTRPRSAR